MVQQETQSKHLVSRLLHKMRGLDYTWSFPARKFHKPVNGVWQVVSLWCITVEPG